MLRLFTVLSLLVLLVSNTFAQSVSVPPLLNFQGRLAKPDGTPVAEGNYSLRFSLHDAVSGGTEKWNQTFDPVTVKNGTFAVLLSGFPAGTFAGNLWLEIKIGADAPLTPRQQLVSVAYAMKADSVTDGAITGASIANGAITADKFASGIFNPLAWLLGGNSGTNPSTHFLGTTDNQPFVLKVNNQRALRLEYAYNDGASGFNTLGGVWTNSISPGAVGATVWGGVSAFGARPNQVRGEAGTVSGGASNIADAFGTVGGGNYNYAGGNQARLGGYATVGGGDNNSADSFGDTIGGGQYNETSGHGHNTIGGGGYNTINGSSATIAGGEENFANGGGSTVAGGSYNIASGTSATVAGGDFNIAAGDYSFAAGHQAVANHTGTFVWADNSHFVDFTSTGANQFLVLASGGVGINKNNPAPGALDVAGNGVFSGSVLLNGLRFPIGAGAGKILTSDASGNSSWRPVSIAGISAGGDLTGTYPAPTIGIGKVTNAHILNATITADKFASGTLNPLAWLLSGNSGTNANTHFIGTTDTQPLVFKVNNQRAVVYQYTETGTYRSLNVWGGSDINSIGAGVVGATIAGGGWDNFTGTDFANRVLANFGTVGGGYGNTSNGTGAVVGGGALNTASNTYAVVGGGYSNNASNTYATVVGGAGNVASHAFASVGGGGSNAANGDYGAIPGGYLNTVTGSYAFAAGNRAKANHNGAFVWADSNNADFPSSAVNEFNVRASGGVRIYTNAALSAGVTLEAGGGSWNSVSDRNAKTNFQPVDVLDVLEKLASLPLTTWHYKANSNIRHMGVMAQDFYAAFGGLGVDDKHISTLDADGVALAAIQGLNRKLEAKEKRLSALEAENAELKARLDALAATVAELKADRK